MVRSEGGLSEGGEAEIRETARIELEGDSQSPLLGGGGVGDPPLPRGPLYLSYG